MRVRRGDDVTVYSDCVYKNGLPTVWFRNCSHENQPPFIMSSQEFIQYDMKNNDSPRYSFVWNPLNGTHDLLIKNVTEAHLGLYYCALMQRDIIKNLYQYGIRATRLSLQEEASMCVTISPNTPTPQVPEWTHCWKLLVSLWTVCVVLAIILSICVYCICTNKTKARTKRQTHRNDEVVGELCYASLDIKTFKKRNKNRAQQSDLYSEVRTECNIDGFS
ncbi:uncharacterized protein LOC134326711 [Trichomycterus rosablanca]|uniref:uncharacterized protein LOC134326711 n=1 Tax=Trichomycterus rosablanca TaxID=2290929 RepID=UPI002F3605FF